MLALIPYGGYVGDCISKIKLCGPIVQLSSAMTKPHIQSLYLYIAFCTPHNFRTSADSTGKGFTYKTVNSSFAETHISRAGCN